MKSGIYFSKSPPPKDFAVLKAVFALDHAGTVAVLRKKLKRSGCDFVYLDVGREAMALEVIHAAFAIDPTVVLLTPHDLDIPEMAHVYRLPEKGLVSGVVEILSFHQAKKNNELQTVYGVFDERGHDYFYLSEHAPLGIILTDAEDGIIYANHKAKRMIGFDDQKKFLRSYLKLDSVMTDVPAETGVIGTTRFLGVMQKVVFSGKNRLGAITYLEDVAQKRKGNVSLIREKERYERLTMRLNDILLKDLGSNAYNLAYLKRKIDLEIKHAQKGQSDVCLYYFAITDVEKKLPEQILRRAVLAQITGLLLQKFPDPHVVGILRDGHWLVIVEGEGVEVVEKPDALAGELSRAVGSFVADAKVDVMCREVTDFKKYRNSEDLIRKVAGSR